MLCESVLTLWVGQAIDASSLIEVIKEGDPAAQESVKPAKQLSESVEPPAKIPKKLEAPKLLPKFHGIMKACSSRTSRKEYFHNASVVYVALTALLLCTALRRRRLRFEGTGNIS